MGRGTHLVGHIEKITGHCDLCDIHIVFNTGKQRFLWNKLHHKKCHSDKNSILCSIPQNTTYTLNKIILY